MSGGPARPAPSLALGTRRESRDRRPYPERRAKVERILVSLHRLREAERVARESRDKKERVRAVAHARKDRRRLEAFLRAGLERRVGERLHRRLAERRVYDVLAALGLEVPGLGVCACGAVFPRERSTGRWCSARCRQLRPLVRRPWHPPVSVIRRDHAGELVAWAVCVSCGADLVDRLHVRYCRSCSTGAARTRRSRRSTPGVGSVAVDEREKIARLLDEGWPTGVSPGLLAICTP